MPNKSSEPNLYTKIRSFFTNPMSVLRRPGISMLSGISIDFIEKNLYLGSRRAASDIPTLEKYKITHILSIEDCPLDDEISKLKNVTVKFIELSDYPKEDILSHFEEAHEFITNGLSKGAVLVHCFFGISRSATLVIAHIMKKHHLNYNEAYERVKKQRKRVCPNSGFVEQLNLYHEMGYQVDYENVKCKSLLVNVASSKLRQYRALPENFQHLVKSVDENQAKSHFSCKKCRKILAGEANQIVHTQKHKIEVCRNLYFFEPLVWMKVERTISDKLVCPQCKTEVGAFDWMTGFKCSCNDKPAPEFWLTNSEVDFVKI